MEAASAAAAVAVVEAAVAVAREMGSAGVQGEVAQAVVEMA